MALKHRLVVGVALALAGVAAPASAQDQAAPAESLFDEGRKLLAVGRYPEACAKLAESEKLDPAVGTLLNLGECYEKMGKIATAWAVYKQATAMAHGKQPAREKIAAARTAVLEPTVPRLSISVPHAVPGLEVSRDGLSIGQAEWSGPIPSEVTIDPGEHQIVVVAPGRKPWTTKVTLVANGANTAVEVPELEADELAERAPLKPSSGERVRSLEVVNTHDRNVQRAIGAAMGGAGLVSLIVGIPFGARAISLNKTAAGECPTNNTCSTQGASDSQSAVSNALTSSVFISIGAGVIVGGAIVYFTAPKPKREPGAAMQLVPDFSRNGGGLHVIGSF
jgi:hypothetical protein